MVPVEVVMTLFLKPKITKLDSRYAGGQKFDYCLEFYHPHSQGREFCEIREWCWQTWGPGRELKFLDYNTEYKWAFLVDGYRTRIYLSGNEELSWYKLRWM
jgi:hypothetical protein